MSDDECEAFKTTARVMLSELARQEQDGWSLSSVIEAIAAQLPGWRNKDATDEEQARASYWDQAIDSLKGGDFEDAMMLLDRAAHLGDDDMPERETKDVIARALGFDEFVLWRALVDASIEENADHDE